MQTACTHLGTQRPWLHFQVNVYYHTLYHIKPTKHQVKADMGGVSCINGLSDYTSFTLS